MNTTANEHGPNDPARRRSFLIALIGTAVCGCGFPRPVSLNDGSPDAGSTANRAPQARQADAGLPPAVAYGPLDAQTNQLLTHISDQVVSNGLVSTPYYHVGDDPNADEAFREIFQAAEVRKHGGHIVDATGDTLTVVDPNGDVTTTATTFGVKMVTVVHPDGSEITKAVEVDGSVHTSTTSLTNNHTVRTETWADNAGRIYQNWTRSTDNTTLQTSEIRTSVAADGGVKTVTYGNSGAFKSPGYWRVLSRDQGFG